MTIKEVWEKIKKIFSGDNIKELPEGAESPAQAITTTERKSFLDGLRVDVHMAEKTGMESDYNALVEEYNRLIDEYEMEMSKVYLTANGIEFDEQDDVVTMAKKEKEKFIEQAIDEAEKEYEGDHFSRKFAQISAKQDWKRKPNSYMQEAFGVYIESKHKDANGENHVLTEEQTRQKEFMGKILELNTKMISIRGAILGMEHAAYTHSLTTEKSIDRAKEIEESMSETKKIAALFKYKARVKGLEVDGATDIDRMMYVIDRTEDDLQSFMNFNFYREYEGASSYYSKYLENGGDAPKLDIFDSELRDSEYFSWASEATVEKHLEEYETLVQSGHISEAEIDGNDER